ncbi:hypothetical protein SVAN01_08212 [Stagonosporopsis vannaccii]|nr:hypothetical protein SVAN01_08212 [Stagonosporopsis vannaccii]
MHSVQPSREQVDRVVARSLIHAIRRRRSRTWSKEQDAIRDRLGV